MTHQHYTGVAGFVGQIGAGVALLFATLLAIRVVLWLFGVELP